MLDHDRASPRVLCRLLERVRQLEHAPVVTMASHDLEPTGSPLEVNPPGTESRDSP